MAPIDTSEARTAIDRDRHGYGSACGVRAEWICALCRKEETTRQIVDLAKPQLGLPSGWRVVHGLTFCRAHPETFIQVELKATG